MLSLMNYSTESNPVTTPWSGNILPAPRSPACSHGTPPWSLLRRLPCHSAVRLRTANTRRQDSHGAESVCTDVFYVPSAHRSPHANLLHFNSRRTLLRSEATYPLASRRWSASRNQSVHVRATQESREPLGSDGEMEEPLVEKCLRTGGANRHTFIITIRKPTVHCSHNTGAGGGPQRRSQRGAPPPGQEACSLAAIFCPHLFM